MDYNGCKITIASCQAPGWRGWFDYAVANGQQSITGRSRGTMREVVSALKWKIDHNEMFPKLEGNLTKRAADVCPTCGGSGIKEAAADYIIYCLTCDGWGTRR